MKPNGWQNRLLVTLLIAGSIAFAPQSIEAKKASAPAEPAARPARKPKPESPECAACCKEASRLFATGKSMDALKLLRANQVDCRDSARFNLLMSTILLRMPTHEKEAAQAAATAVELDPASVAANFQLAICLTASGETERAVQAYEKLVKIDPANYEAWSALGTLYTELHDTPRSKAAAAKAAVLEPNSRIARVRAAQNLFKQGKTALMAAELDRMIIDEHLEPEFFIALSKDALDMQSYAEAIKAADRVLGAYPKLSDAIKTKAQAQLWKRQYEDALATIGKIDARTMDGDNHAMAIKSLLLIKLGKTKEARSLVSKLPKRSTEDPLGSLARAYMAERNGDVEEAIEQLESALRHNQVFAPPHIELARIYLRQGRAEEDIIAESKEIQRSKPYIASGKAFESRLALEQAPAREKVEAALRIAREAVKLDGDDPEALTALALSELKGGKLDAARELINKALGIEPGHIDALLAAARILESEGKQAKRVEALQALTEIAPGDSEVLSALAQAYAEGGDASSAIKLLRDRVENTRADPVLVFALARAYEKSGRSKDAARFFKQSLSEGLTGQRASLAKDALKNIGSKIPDEM